MSAVTNPKFKIITGYVMQHFNEQGVCTSQEFVASDQVDWEDEFGRHIEEPEHTYCPMNMEQPCAR